MRPLLLSQLYLSSAPHDKSEPQEGKDSLETHGRADGGERGANLGTVHAQLLTQPLQHLQVLLAPLARAVVRHVPTDLRGKYEESVRERGDCRAMNAQLIGEALQQLQALLNAARNGQACPCGSAEQQER